MYFLHSPRLFIIDKLKEKKKFQQAIILSIILEKNILQEKKETKSI